MDFPIMEPTRVGLPNSCSRCAQPVQEGHWMAEHDDAARSGSALCVHCYVEEKALQQLAEVAEAAETEPNLLEQLIADIPDEDILVSGAAVDPEKPVTKPVVSDTAVDPEKPVTKPKPKRKPRARKS